MVEEYTQIAQAFFSLYGQLNQILQTYLAVMTGASAAVTFLFQVLPRLYPGVSSASDLTVLGALLILLGLLGLMAFFALIGIRMEMLLYAKTINRIRAYFYDKDSKRLHGYLVLPIDATAPNFREGIETGFFWEAQLVGTFNSAVVATGVLLLWSRPFSLDWPFYLIGLVGVGIVAHALAYTGLARLNTKHFNKHHPDLVASASDGKVTRSTVCSSCDAKTYRVGWQWPSAILCSGCNRRVADCTCRRAS